MACNADAAVRRCASPAVDTGTACHGANLVSRSPCPCTRQRRPSCSTVELAPRDTWIREVRTRTRIDLHDATTAEDDLRTVLDRDLERTAACALLGEQDTFAGACTVRRWRSWAKRWRQPPSLGGLGHDTANRSLTRTDGPTPDHGHTDRRRVEQLASVHIGQFSGRDRRRPRPSWVANTIATTAMPGSERRTARPQARPVNQCSPLQRKPMRVQRVLIRTTTALPRQVKSSTSGGDSPT